MMGVDAMMYARTRIPVTDQQVSQWAWELGEAFGHKAFMTWRQSDGLSRDYRALMREKPSDNDEHYSYMPHAAGWTVLRCALFGRYYGEGYERGDLPLILAVARWLEDKIPGAEVWYGGDSGERVEPFPVQERERLWAHFVAVGHRPYRSGWERGGQSVLCGFCDHVMLQCGWGGGDSKWAKFECVGCGQEVETTDGEAFTVTAKVGGRPVEVK